MPFAIRQRVWTIEWSIERTIGGLFGKEGFGKRREGWNGNKYTVFLKKVLHEREEKMQEKMKKT